MKHSLPNCDLDKQNTLIPWYIYITPAVLFKLSTNAPLVKVEAILM